MPIRENSVARPDRANVLRAVRVLEEYIAVAAIGVNAVVVAGIVRVGNVDGTVDNWDIVLSVCLKHVEEILAFLNTERIRVLSEIAVLEHV